MTNNINNQKLEDIKNVYNETFATFARVMANNIIAYIGNKWDVEVIAPDYIDIILKKNTKYKFSLRYLIKDYGTMIGALEASIPNCGMFSVVHDKDHIQYYKAFGKLISQTDFMKYIEDDMRKMLMIQSKNRKEIESLMS